MLKTRLREIAEKLCDVDMKCRYAKKCKRFSEDSETCMNALYKEYCGEFKRIEARENL